MKITQTVPLTHCDEKLVRTILQEYKIFNAELGKGPFRNYVIPLVCIRYAYTVGLTPT